MRGLSPAGIRRLGAGLCALWSLACAAGTAVASDLQIHPLFSVGEEFNDNLFEDPARKHSDFITRVTPGVAGNYKGPHLKSELSYGLEYINYARGGRSDEYNHRVALAGQAVAVRNFFFVDFSESLTRVSLDVARDRTLESSFLNQSDQNIATVSPFLVFRLGDRSTLKSGYRYNDTRYFSSEGVDKQEHGAFAELELVLSPRATLTVGHTFGHTRTDVGSYDIHSPSAELRYNYADRSFVFGQIGYSFMEFSNGRTPSEINWRAGLTHDFGTVLAILESRVQHTEDPLTLATTQTSYNGRIEKEFSRGALGVFSTYSEYVFTVTGERDRRQLSVGADARYDIAPKLGGGISVLGDRTSRKVVADYPYHAYANAFLAYDCNYDLKLSLRYTFATYRFEIDNDRGSTDINRVIFDLRKTF